MQSDTVKITLSAEKDIEAQTAFIYYGSFQGGWQKSSAALTEEGTAIEIKKAENIELLKTLTEKKRLPFHPEIVRIVLPYGTCYFKEIIGDIQRRRNRNCRKGHILPMVLLSPMEAWHCLRPAPIPFRSPAGWGQII